MGDTSKVTEGRGERRITYKGKEGEGMGEDLTRKGMEPGGKRRGLLLRGRKEREKGRKRRRESPNSPKN